MRDICVGAHVFKILGCARWSTFHKKARSSNGTFGSPFLFFFFLCGACVAEVQRLRCSSFDRQHYDEVQSP